MTRSHRMNAHVPFEIICPAPNPGRGIFPYFWGLKIENQNRMRIHKIILAFEKERKRGVLGFARKTTIP